MLHRAYPIFIIFTFVFVQPPVTGRFTGRVFRTPFGEHPVGPVGVPVNDPLTDARRGLFGVRLPICGFLLWDDC